MKGFAETVSPERHVVYSGLVPISTGAGSTHIIVYGKTLQSGVARVEVDACLRPAGDGGKQTVEFTPGQEALPCDGTYLTQRDAPVNGVFAVIVPRDGSGGIGLCQVRVVGREGQVLQVDDLLTCRK